MAMHTRRKPGFTIIETIFSMAILTFLILALFSIMTSNLAALFNTKSRSVALNIAQEKIEDLKNMPYDSLATVSGTIYPAGAVLDQETLVRNNLRLKVTTDIRYVDNTYDGNATGTVPNKPVDLYSYDYKKITVRIYTANGSQKLAELSSDIAAKAAETAGNTGVLIVRVINAAGAPVENATVQIINTNPNPDVNITTTTDVQGQVAIPKLPPDLLPGYHVVITKSGYSNEQTFAQDVAHPVPTNPDFGLLAQQTTIKTFAIDQLTNLTLSIKTPTGTAIANQAVTINGQKTSNTTPAVYISQQTGTTDSNGAVAFNLIDWDSYDISLSGYKILSSSPFQPVTVAPNSFATAFIVAAPTPTSYPVIEQLNPLSSQAVPGVTLDISGSNFTAGSTIILRKAGQSDRVVTGIAYAAPDSLSGTVDLSGAAQGSWSLVVTTGGLTTTQPDALTVVP